MNKENETIDNSKPMAYDTGLGVVDSNGKDYSHLKKSAYYIDPTYECNQCGSTLVTELDDKDICHDCGLFILKLPLTLRLNGRFNAVLAIVSHRFKFKV